MHRNGVLVQIQVPVRNRTKLRAQTKQRNKVVGINRRGVFLFISNDAGIEAAVAFDGGYVSVES